MHIAQTAGCVRWIVSSLEGKSVAYRPNSGMRPLGYQQCRRKKRCISPKQQKASAGLSVVQKEKALHIAPTVECVRWIVGNVEGKSVAYRPNSRMRPLSYQRC